MPLPGERERRRSSKRTVGGIKFYQQNQNESAMDDSKENEAYFEGGDKQNLHEDKLESMENDENSNFGKDQFRQIHLESEEQPKQGTDFKIKNGDPIFEQNLHI